MFTFSSVLITTSALRLQNKETSSYAVLYKEKFYLSYIVIYSTAIQTELKLIH